MSLLSAPTETQIEAQLGALLDRRPDARILGIRSPARRSWREVLECRGRRFRVAWCDSELQIREQLDAIECNETDGIVVLTPLDAANLGCDLVARFPRARLEEADRW